MANATIERVGPGEYGLICELYNAVFHPPANVAYFRSRLAHHRRALVMIAELEGRAVGFSCGYELRPTTYYSWLCGVLPDARRMGIASQLVSAEHAWARDHHYEVARLECYNQHRAMLLLALKKGYEIVGIRWDSRAASNLVVFEKHITGTEE